MPEITVVVKHKLGLPLRPMRKSPLSVMTLGANQGAEITIKAEGEDAEDALAALEEPVNNNIGDEL